MKRAIGLCVLGLLVAGSAYGVDFTWAATATSSWTTASDWSPGYRYPGYSGASAPTTAQQTFAAGDTVTITNGVKMNVLTANGYYVVGDFTLADTAFQYSGSPSTRYLYCLDDNGHNGDFTLGGTSNLYYYCSGFIYVDGNVLVTGGTTGGLSNNVKPTLVMQGGGKLQTIDSSGAYPFGKITIETGANVQQQNNVPRTNDLEVKGTLSGNIRVGYDTGTRTVTHTGTWTSGELQIQKAGQNDTRYLDIGGTSTYPTINTRPAEPGTTTPNRQNTRQTSDIACDRLWFNKGYSGGAQTRNWIDTWDTQGYDLAAASEFTIGGGGAYTSTSSIVYAGFYANDSTIDINGPATFGRHGYVVGGTSTWKFAGDVTFDRTVYTGTGWGSGRTYFFFDNTDMSQTTVVIDGAGTQQLTFTDLLMLGDVEVAQTSSTVQINDDLMLAGDLKFTSASTVVIPNEKHGFIFKGGIDNFDNAQIINVNNADLINVTILALNPASYVKLGSDLTISDNLNIAAGCKLFIGTHTLDLTGSDAAAFLGQNVLSGAGVWTVAEGGEIIGSGVIPEPSTLLLLGTGLIGAVGYVRRRRMR